MSSSSDDGWMKWRACDPTSAHWYSPARLARYAAAHVARDQDQGRERTVREFIAESCGLSSSAKQKSVLEESGRARMPLAAPVAVALRDVFGNVVAQGIVADPELLGCRLYASAGTHKKINAAPLGMQANAALDLLVRSRPPASRHASQPAHARGDDHWLQNISRTHNPDKAIELAPESVGILFFCGNHGTTEASH